MKQTPKFLQELRGLKASRFLLLTVAGLINAFGITIFLSPVKLYDSGISGTSMLLAQITPEAWTLSIFLILLNVPLFLYGLKRQGIVFTVYAIYAVAVYSLGAWLITDVLPVDVTMASPLAGSDLLLCALFGGLISGLGSGLAIRSGGAMDGIDWPTVWLFAGMLSMSFAIDDSGAGKIIADFVVAHVSDPYALFGVLLLACGVLTNLMSNTACTAIMVPLVIPIAIGAGLSPLPFVMGIAMNAAACFMTPIATPSNALVLKPGGYTWGDYARYGLPWQIIAYLLSILIIPTVWPFQP